MKHKKTYKRKPVNQSRNPNRNVKVAMIQVEKVPEEATITLPISVYEGFVASVAKLNAVLAILEHKDAYAGDELIRAILMPGK